VARADPGKPSAHLSPFHNQPRITAKLADTRNQLVAALAEHIFVAHAAPGSKTESLCRELGAKGKRLWTVPCQENQNLFALGALPLAVDTLRTELR
jgi:predicted Rossmann fold nucleotide-binding protein DprA/Smf involved in DNA uptake